MIAHKTRKSKGGQYALKKLIHSFTARKILELLLTLLIVTFLSFLLVKLSPVDAAEAYARRTFMLYTPEQLDELREEMGLNQPLLVQYGTWCRFSNNLLRKNSSYML